MSLFAASRRKRKPFSLHSLVRKMHFSSRANCRTRVRARALLPTYARYLFGGNHGRNFVSMGIVWQQVGKISTHWLLTTTRPPRPPFPPTHTVLYGNTISFSPAIFRPCFPMPRILASNSRFPARTTSRGKLTIARKTMHRSVTRYRVIRWYEKKRKYNFSIVTFYFNYNSF